eukprot:6486002-Amphidinium_carterae.1
MAYTTCTGRGTRQRRWQKLHRTTNGVPKGLAFACVLKLVIKDFAAGLAAQWQTFGDHAQAQVYADDIVSVTDPAVAHVVWDEWHGALAKHLLKVNFAKTIMYSPSQRGTGPLRNHGINNRKLMGWCCVAFHFGGKRQAQTSTRLYQSGH